MTKILILMTALLPFAVVEGGTGCLANLTPPGKPCIQDEVLNGQLNMDVRYSVTSTFTRICCEALACTDFRGCRFKDMGCIQGTMTSRRLPWELQGINPMTRCFTNNQTNTAFYSFVVRVA